MPTQSIRIHKLSWCEAFLLITAIGLHYSETQKHLISDTFNICLLYIFLLFKCILIVKCVMNSSKPVILFSIDAAIWFSAAGCVLFLE